NRSSSPSQARARRLLARQEGACCPDSNCSTKYLQPKVRAHVEVARPGLDAPPRTRLPAPQDRNRDPEQKESGGRVQEPSAVAAAQEEGLERARARGDRGIPQRSRRREGEAEQEKPERRVRSTGRHELRQEGEIEEQHLRVRDVRHEPLAQR